MNTELRRMDRLREVMRLSSRGRGMAASIAEAFLETSEGEETRAVRSILLGLPVDDSVSLMAGSDGHVRSLLLFLARQARVDAVSASRRAERLAKLFEHWVRAEQQRLVDQRIMETRSLMVSAIVGGVTSMVASIAPVLSSFQVSISQPQPALTGGDPFLGLLFVVPAAFFLGLFFSPRRAILDVSASVAAYALVAYFFGPLVLGL